MRTCTRSDKGQCAQVVVPAATERGRDSVCVGLSSRPLPRIYAPAALSIFAHNLVAVSSDDGQFPISSSAYTVELVFEGNTRIALLVDESAHDVEDPLVQIIWSRAEGKS